MKKFLFILLLNILPLGEAWWGSCYAQVGEYRNDLAVGVNGGYMLSQVGFSPKIPQTFLGGYTGGLTVRYTCEKYFSMICSVQGEVNLAQVGWKEKIRTLDNKPVLNPRTGLNDEYQCRLNYVQVPLFCHVAFGKEKRGANFFVNLGPQVGFMLGGRKVTSNYSTNPYDQNYGNYEDRVCKIYAQDTIATMKKFDYGICAGAGVELNLKRFGHVTLDARYYLGLANLYGASKADYFGKSNNSVITVKMTYLFDIVGRKD